MPMKKENGFLMISVIILIFILGFLTVAISYIVVSESSSTLNQYYKSQSFYAAESGLNYASYYLTNTNTVNDDTRLSCSALNGLSAYVNSGASPSNQFVLSTTNSYNASQLNGAINDTATSLTVDNGSVFSSSGGRVVIDREAINYAKVSGNTLLNLNRGIDGTVAASHPDNAFVSQNQCLITSSGFTPSATTINGMTPLQQSTQLEYGLAVGTNGYYSSWNGSQWSNEVQTSPSKNINNITMLSSHEAIAVGAVSSYAVVWRWNGSNWSREGSSTTVGDEILNAISCSSHSNCWAVGDRQTTKIATIIQYDGSAWIKRNPNFTPSNAQNLNGITCPNNSECIAVGNSNQTLKSLNGSWSIIASTPGTFDFFSVDCPSSTLSSCWAGGGGSHMCRFNGTTWSDMQLPSGIVRSIFCSKNASDPGCYALTSTERVFFKSNPDNDVNDWVQLGGTLPCLVNIHGSIQCFNSRNCWVACSNGTLTHYNGASWQLVTPPAGSIASADFRGIALIGSHSNPLSNWKEV